MKTVEESHVLKNVGETFFKMITFLQQTWQKARNGFKIFRSFLDRVAQAIRSESVINTGHNNVYNSGQPAQS